MNKKTKTIKKKQEERNEVGERTQKILERMSKVGYPHIQVYDTFDKTYFRLVNLKQTDETWTTSDDGGKTTYTISENLDEEISNKIHYAVKPQNLWERIRYGSYLKEVEKIKKQINKEALQQERKKQKTFSRIKLN
jgi:hypothetical protein